MGLEPEIDSNELERRIAAGVHADLLSACRELGIAAGSPKETEKSSES